MGVIVGAGTGGASDEEDEDFIGHYRRSFIARKARERFPEIAAVYMTGDSAADCSPHGVPDSILLQRPFANAQVLTAVSTLLNKAVQRGS